MQSLIKKGIWFWGFILLSISGHAQADIINDVKEAIKLGSSKEIVRYLNNSIDITIDGNPALAGVTLHYDVDVMDIRAATAEELSHGHIHSPDGGCGHSH